MMKIKNNMIFLFNQSLDKYAANSAKELKPQEVEILSAMVNTFSSSTGGSSGGSSTFKNCSKVSTSLARSNSS